MNTDQGHTRQERLDIIRKFSQKLIDSGHSQEVCKEITKSGLTRFFRLVLLEVAGERILYRSADDMKEGRVLKKFHSKFWFRTRRGGTRVAERLDVPEMNTKTDQGRSRKEGKQKDESQEECDQ